MPNLGPFLALLVEIVNDDTMRWGEKKDLIMKKAQEDEDLATALAEFVSWFEAGDLDS